MALLAALFLSPFPRASAQTFVEDFSASPASRGWSGFGDTNLFRWDAAARQLEVTWDSSKPNSYFHRPLGVTLTKRDDFALAFDVRLRDIAVGTTPGKPYTFQIAAGLLNLAGATRSNFFRGTGFDSPNVAEFDYFPDSGFGATVAPTIISAGHQFASSFNFPVELTTNDLFHVELTYTAGNRVFATVMTRNGETFGPIADATQPDDFGDFALDALAVMSYSDEGQDPLFAGSVLAHGLVDNVRVTTPPPPVAGLAGGFANGRWRARFSGRAGWSYTLERTENFSAWTPAAPPVPGVDGALMIEDARLPAGQAFYRVRAERP